MTENDSDHILSRVLGENMQQATVRMVLYLAIAAAAVATIVMLFQHRA
jgi:cell division protein FtsL